MTVDRGPKRVQTGDSRRLEHWVHRVLLTGLAVSALLIISGLGVALIRHENRPLHRPPPPGIVLRQAFTGSGVAQMELALLSLMATPVLRVLVLAVGWAREREWRLAAVAVTVLVLLGLGFALGMG